MNLSIFFPAYNEEDNIALMVKDALKIAPQVSEDFEIIVIDDGSSDRTAQVVREIAKEFPQVRLVSHDKNRGYGAALKTGMDSATKDYIFYCDSDNQFDLSELPRLVDLIDEADLVIGYRLNRQDPWMRIVMARVYNLLVSIIFGLRVKDVDCGFKLFRRRILDQLPLTLRSKGYLLETALLVRSQKAGLRIKEVGVRHRHRARGSTSFEIGGRSKIFTLVKPRVIWDTLVELGQFWKELRLSPNPPTTSSPSGGR